MAHLDKATSLYKFKRGANPGYESLADKRERERKDLIKKGLLDQKKTKPHQFRGFVAGAQFRTKLGFQGNAFDALWGKHIFASFLKDDVELFDVAMKSSLADIHMTVEGGEFGTAFQIGDLGFYAKSQFNYQGDKIRKFERNFAKGTYFLTKDEWGEIDEKIQNIVTVAPPLIGRAINGDTFGALALRDNAFKVAKRMVEIGLDPLVENAEGEDLCSIVSEQYNTLTGLMHEILEEKEHSKHRVMVPSESADLERREVSRLDDFKHMKLFATEFLEKMEARERKIHDDKQMKRRLELKLMPVSQEMLWNISCEAKCTKHVKEMRNLIKQLTSRIDTYEKDRAEHMSLSDLMHMQHKVVTRKGYSPKQKVWSHKDDEEEEVSRTSDFPEPDMLPLPEGEDDGDDSSHHARLLEDKLKKAADREREMLKAAHGVETLAEKEAREQAERDAIEETQLMAISLEKEREEEEEKKKKDRLLLETFEPTLGVLRSQKNDDGHVVEEIHYR